MFVYIIHNKISNKVCHIKIRFYSKANKICQPKTHFSEVCELLPVPTCLDIYGLGCNASQKCECINSDYKYLIRDHF